VDGKDVEEQGKEDNADASTAGGEPGDDDRWTTTENDKTNDSERRYASRKRTMINRLKSRSPQELSQGRK